MSDEKKIKLYMVGIGAVIISIIIFLVIIWSNFFKSLKPVPVEEQEITIGNFTYVNYQDSDIAKKYFNIIRSKLEDADVEDLYNNYVSQEYKDKYNYTLDSFRESLQKKKLLGIQLNYDSFDKYVINGKTVYSTDIKALDKSTTIKLNVIENKPSDFTITFDDFILKDTKETEQIVNGLKLTIKNKEYYTGRIIVNTSLENLNDFDVYLNVNRRTENGYFSTGASEYITQSTILASEIAVLNPNSTMNYTFTNNVVPSTYSYFSSLLIKDVKLSENGETIDLSYSLK